MLRGLQSRDPAGSLGLRGTLELSRGGGGTTGYPGVGEEGGGGGGGGVPNKKS